MVKELVLPYAGSIKLEKRTSTGAISTEQEDTYISALNAVKKITRDVSINKTPIETGNSLDPVRKVTTSYVNGISPTLNSFDRQIYRMGSGATKSDVSTDAKATLVIEDEVTKSGTGDDATYDVTLKYTIDSITKVYDRADGSEIVAIGSSESLATGKYELDATNNKLSFFSDMDGKKVTIEYVAKASKNSTDSLANIPTSGTYRVTLNYQADGLTSADNKVMVTAVYDSLEFAEGIAYPDNSKDMSDWTFKLTSVASQGTTRETVTYTDVADITVFTKG